jgi:phosphomannomutase
VGDKYVYEYMHEHECRIGGEESGHIIFSKYASTGDGILTSVKMMEVMLARKKKMSELAAPLRIYPQVLVNVRVKDKHAAQADPAVQEAVRQAEPFLGQYAISVLPSEGLESPNVVGAQAANELLNIVGVKASFVVTEFDGRIFISARAIDEVNVQVIMEKLGGGGHMNIAGAQLEGVTVEEAVQKLRDTLTEMVENGEI